ncbi:hypothetical protein GIB67_020009 [Kingdonia uniflora]|uniref:Uncharacterized protein n=1 Tax=Kingdonia uniflora TaxID=39325 RepID=A0A7J7MI37_9MAGN|nr:hypothetical protein GIB67_020009 [Kingdonia uniflora]
MSISVASESTPPIDSTMLEDVDYIDNASAKTITNKILKLIEEGGSIEEITLELQKVVLFLNDEKVLFAFSIGPLLKLRKFVDDYVETDSSATKAAFDLKIVLNNIREKVRDSIKYKEMISSLYSNLCNEGSDSHSDSESESDSDGDNMTCTVRRVPDPYPPTTPGDVHNYLFKEVCFLLPEEYHKCMDDKFYISHALLRYPDLIKEGVDLQTYVKDVFIDVDLKKSVQDLVSFLDLIDVEKLESTYKRTKLAKKIKNLLNALSKCDFMDEEEDMVTDSPSAQSDTSIEVKDPSKDSGRPLEDGEAGQLLDSAKKQKINLALLLTFGML